jgi:hypothetical protein
MTTGENEIEKIVAAAQEIALHIRDSYTSSHGVHAETVIATAAIAGDWSLWARGLPLPDLAAESGSGSP